MTCWCQVIIWTNAGILSIQTLWTNLREILKKFWKNAFENVVREIAEILSWLQCVNNRSWSCWPLWLMSSYRPITWTAKMLVRYILSPVCLRLGQFSQLSFMQYMGLCVFSLPISLVMIVRILSLDLIIIIKSEVWPFCHCLGLGHETMLCIVCLSMFL